MGRIIGPYAKAKATHLLHSHQRANAVAKDHNIRCHTSTVYTWEQRLQIYQQISQLEHTASWDTRPIRTHGQLGHTANQDTQPFGTQLGYTAIQDTRLVRTPGLGACIRILYQQRGGVGIGGKGGGDSDTNPTAIYITYYYIRSIQL